MFLTRAALALSLALTPLPALAQSAADDLRTTISGWEQRLEGRIGVAVHDSGAGIAASSELFAAPLVRKGELVRVLPEWDLPTATGWASASRPWTAWGCTCPAARPRTRHRC